MENRQAENDEYWSEKVHTHFHTPPGTFTKDAGEVVKALMKGADNNATEALRRLVFYMNRAGEKLTNREQLNKAKLKLEQLEKQQKN